MLDGAHHLDLVGVLDRVAEDLDAPRKGEVRVHVDQTGQDRRVAQVAGIGRRRAEVGALPDTRDLAIFNLDEGIVDRLGAQPIVQPRR